MASRNRVHLGRERLITPSGPINYSRSYKTSANILIRFSDSLYFTQICLNWSHIVNMSRHIRFSIVSTLFSVLLTEGSIQLCCGPESKPSVNMFVHWMESGLATQWLAEAHTDWYTPHTQSSRVSLANCLCLGCWGLCLCGFCPSCVVMDAVDILKPHTCQRLK